MAAYFIIVIIMIVYFFGTIYIALLVTYFYLAINDECQRFELRDAMSPI